MQTSESEEKNAPQEKPRRIFRQEALDRLSSPEQLDQSMRLVRPLDWLILTGLGTMVTLAVVWGIFGKIPVTVTGRGILVRPRRVVQLQSPISGQLESVKVRDGQCFEKDDVLATINPSAFKQQLELQKDRLKTLVFQARDTKTLQDRRTEVELTALDAKRRSLQQRLQDAKALSPILQTQTIAALQEQRQKYTQRLRDTETLTPQLKNQQLQAIAQQRDSFQQRLQDAKAVTPELKDKGLEAIAQQRETLQQRWQQIQELTPQLRDQTTAAVQEQRESLRLRLQDAEELAPVFQQRMAVRQELFEEGAIARDVLLQTEQDYRQNLQEIAQIKAELKQLEVQEVDVQEKYLLSLNNLAEISDRLKQLDLQETEASDRYLQNINTIREIETQLKQLALQETEATERYLQNINQVGEIQVQLQEIKIKETEAQKQYLENLSLISQLQAELQELDTQSKRLEQDNLEAENRRQNEIDQVQQDIAQLEKQIADNSKIVSSQGGCVLEIKAAVGQYVNVGTSLGTMNAASSNQEMVAVTYLNISDGKRVEPGMEIQITPDIVKRQRFGGIVATITSVSQFPVTQEGAAFVLGNPELTQTIMSQNEGNIEVIAELQPDANSPTGYQWSSSAGPKLEITTGTTTTSRVTVEERSPISFVLPFLRELSGID